jgi:arylsulfatase A-like enzyme
MNVKTRIPSKLIRFCMPVVLTAASLAGCSGGAAPRPNILFAIADDWGWFHAGAYGDPVVSTPAFDRLAREGVLFNHAYVSSPSCTPSRNAILTGQYHWRLGPGANLHSTLDPSFPVYPLLLQDAGYHVGHWRKSYGPGKSDGWDEHPAGKEYESGFEEFLAARPADAPFCFWLGSDDPHRPYDEGSGVASGIDPAGIKLFGCFPDHPVVRSDVADYYFEVQRFDSDVAAAVAKLEAIGELENTIIVVTGDHGMPFPRCKSNQYDSGTRVPLAIRWGRGIDHPGRTLDDFVSLTDIAPTFLRIAGLEVPDGMTGRSLVPLLRSDREGLVDSTNRSFVLHGKERHVPAQEGNLGGYPCRALRTHDYLYIRNFEPERWPAGTPRFDKAAHPGSWLGDCDNGPTKSYMTENRHLDERHGFLWDLAFAKRPADELYDCRKDPEQLHNLAGDPAYAEIQTQLSALLTQQLQEYADPRVTGGGEEFDQHPYFGGWPMHPSAEE